ncbi:MAG: aminopeptidase [Desulfitobacteriaceae bacterium]|nr:aminopeptidase [Desulfitobacteriaceae bacterium]
MKAGCIKICNLLAVTAGDNVVIITDTKVDPSIAEMLYAVVQERGAVPIKIVFPPMQVHGQEPPDSVVAAMQACDTAIIVTSKSATHCLGTQKAAQKGVRVASLPEMVPDMLRRGALTADYEKVSAFTWRLCELLAGAKTCTVVTKQGTDITLDLGGWKVLPHADTGYIQKGSIGNLPAGEALIVPVPGSANGRVVVDITLSCATPGTLEEPVTLMVKDGIVTDVQGGEPAKGLLALFDRYGYNARNLAELALGTNDRARVIGNVLEDEKVLGTAHFGIGNSTSIGGNVYSEIHIDAIFGNPTIYLDGRLLMSDGTYNPEVIEKEDESRIGPVGEEKAPTKWAERVADHFQVREGKLVRLWRDSRGIPVVSQVGNDATARRAAEVYEKREITDLRKVSSALRFIMGLYGALE